MLQCDPDLTQSVVRNMVAILALIVSLGSFAFTMFKGRYDQITGVKPAIVFVYDRENGWQVQNIGAGPALNIIIVIIEYGIFKNKYTKPVRIPPLKKDGSFKILWDLDDQHGFGAAYQDIWGRPYTTTCKDDLNTVRRGKHLRWKKKDIKVEWTLPEHNQIRNITGSVC